jgi:hypothetical protein
MSHLEASICDTIDAIQRDIRAAPTPEAAQAAAEILGAAIDSALVERGLPPRDPEEHARQTERLTQLRRRVRN